MRSNFLSCAHTVIDIHKPIVVSPLCCLESVCSKNLLLFGNLPVYLHLTEIHTPRHTQPICQPLRLPRPHQTRATRDQEQVAEVEVEVAALVAAQTWLLATVQALRERAEKAVEVEAVVKAAEVVEEVVGIETELSRKDRDLHTHNLHRNPVALASLVVA